MNNICVWSSEFPPCEVSHVISRTIFSDQNFLFLWTQSRYQLCQLCPHLLTTNTYKMLISVMALSSRFRMLPAFDRWLRSSFCRTFSISRSLLEVPSWRLRAHHEFAFPRHSHARLLHASTSACNLSARITAAWMITCSNATRRYPKTKTRNRVSRDLEQPIKMIWSGLTGFKYILKTPRVISSRPSKLMREMTCWV